MSHRVDAAEIERVVHDYVRHEFLRDEGDAELTPSTSLIGGGVLSSIALVKLVSFLEERFDIRFAAHEIGEDHLDTVDDITASVLDKLGR